MPKNKEFNLDTLGQIDPVAAAYFKDIAKNQIFLTEEEEIELFEEYTELKSNIHQSILADKACLNEFKAIYEKTVKENKSTAKLTAGYNNKKTARS